MSLGDLGVAAQGPGSTILERLAALSAQVKALEFRLGLQEQRKVEQSQTQTSPAPGDASGADELKKQLVELQNSVLKLQKDLGKRSDDERSVSSSLLLFDTRLHTLELGMKIVESRLARVMGEEGRPGEIDALRAKLDNLSRELAALSGKVGLTGTEALEKSLKEQRGQLDNAFSMLEGQFQRKNEELESKIDKGLDRAADAVGDLGSRYSFLDNNQAGFVNTNDLNKAIKKAEIMRRVNDLIESGDKFALRNRRMAKYSFAADVLALLLFISINLWGVFLFAFPVEERKQNIMGLTIELIALFAVLVCLIVFLVKKHHQRTDLAELRDRMNKFERDEELLGFKESDYLQDEHKELIGSYKTLLAPLSVPRKIQAGISWFNVCASVLIEIMLVTDMLTGGYISKAHGKSPINVEHGLFLGLTCLMFFSVIIELSLVTADYIKQKKNSKCCEKENENTKGSIARIVILSSVVLTTLATITARLLRALEDSKTVTRFGVGAGGELAIGLLIASILCAVDLIFCCVDNKDLFKKEVGTQMEQAQTLRQSVLKATIPTLGGV